MRILLLYIYIYYTSTSYEPWLQDVYVIISTGLGKAAQYAMIWYDMIWYAKLCYAMLWYANVHGEQK
jgi:hypothetical protein